MDIYCRRCGEPYDIDHVNHELELMERVRFKSGEGCPCCYGKQVKKRPFRAEASAVAQDLLGDDQDGVAALLDDAEYLMGDVFNE